MESGLFKRMLEIILSNHYTISLQRDFKWNHLIDKKYGWESEMEYH